MSNKQEVEKLVRRLHRAMAELGDEATDAEWNVLRQKVASALSSVRDMEESDARRKWDAAKEALTAEMARLDLTVLEATTFEGDGLEDGNYIVMLRYDEVLSLRKTLAGLEPKGRGLRVEEGTSYQLGDGRVVVLEHDGYLTVWANMAEYDEPAKFDPDEVVEPLDWCCILSEPYAEAHLEAMKAKRAREQSPCCESPTLPIVKGTCSRCVLSEFDYSETFKRSILLQTGALAEDIQHDLDCWATNLRGLYDDKSIAKMTQLDTTLFRVDFWFQPPRGPKALGQTDEEFIQGLFFEDPEPNHLATFTIIEEK